MKLPNYLFLLASFVVTVSLHAQQQNTDSLLLQVSGPQLPPVVNWIMEHQKNDLNSLQKTTNTELLVGLAEIRQNGVDSFAHYYSGNRGSNLGSNIADYYDDYSTWASFSANPFAKRFITPTLFFDSSIYFFFNQSLRTTTIRTYNTFDKIDTQYFKTYNGSGLVAQRFETASYDAMQNVINAYHYIDTSQSAQGLFQKNNSLKSTYLSNTNLKISDTTEGLNYKTVILYSYDGASNLVSILKGDGNSLPIQFTEKDSFVYDAANRLIAYTNISLTGGTWATWQIDSFEYTGTNVEITRNDEYQLGSNPIHYRQVRVLGPSQQVDTFYNYTVDANGIPTPWLLGAYSYNSNNHITSYEQYGYNSSAEQWETNPVLLSRFYYAFKTDVKTLENSTSENFVQLFPNPVHDKLQLTIQSPDDNVKVAIVNALGQVIQQQEFANSENIQLDVKHLPHGTYVIHVMSNRQSAALKFTKI